MGYYAVTDPTMSAPITINTGINVKKGDVIVTFQWEAGDDGGGDTIAPRDNLGSSYTELSGADQSLGGFYFCGGVGTQIGLGGAYYAVAAGSGTLSVTFNWIYPPGHVPGYAVYVFHGAKFNGNIYFSANGNITASSGSASITTSGLPQTTYHYALLVAYVSDNPCFNALPSLQAQGFKQALTWGDTCNEVCFTTGPSLSDALYYAWKYSAQDFTVNLQFTFQGTTLYGYAIALV